MEALNMAFANVCSLLIVTIVPTSLAIIASYKFWGFESLFWKNSCRP